MSEGLTPKYEVGDVFQINHAHGRGGWIGAFIQATEIKSWGIQGFVAAPGDTHDDQAHYYIRLKWEHLEYIGKAKLVAHNHPTEGDSDARDILQ